VFSEGFEMKSAVDKDNQEKSKKAARDANDTEGEREVRTKTFSTPIILPAFAWVCDFGANADLADIANS
jgi:hypothetical protein